ncbi:N-acetyltransferase family protein [Nonomuraea sp. NPDC003707]
MQQVLLDELGQPAIKFTEGSMWGRRWASRIQAVGPGAAEAVLLHLQGWHLSGPESLCNELISKGAKLVRQAHILTHFLDGLDRFDTDIPANIRCVPCDRAPESVLPAWVSALGPGHPDHIPENNDTVLRQEVDPLLNGTLMGPVLPCSVLAVNEHDEVVAGVVVNDWDGTPWITNGFRDPARSPRGLGTKLLLHSLKSAASDGFSALTGSVSHDNQASLNMCAKLGFHNISTYMTVSLGCDDSTAGRIG